MDIKVVRHKGYELHCSARTMDRGEFVPVLMVVATAWPRRPRTIAVAPGAFATEQAAIDAALAEGIAWVSNYG